MVCSLLQTPLSKDPQVDTSQFETLADKVENLTKLVTTLIRSSQAKSATASAVSLILSSPTKVEAGDVTMIVKKGSLKQSLSFSDREDGECPLSFLILFKCRAILVVAPAGRLTEYLLCQKYMYTFISIKEEVGFL